MSVPSDVSPPRAGSAARQKLAALWRWWSAELAQLVPERLAALGGVARVPVVVLEGEELLLVEPRSAVGPDSRVDLAALDEAGRRAALRSLLARAGETRDRLRLCLSHGEALVRRVSLPSATEENLRQVLAFEMDRLTPFRADDVYFDYRVIARNAASAQLTALVAVARRDIVDGKLARFRGWGANVQGVTVREDAGSAAALDLLPLEQRGERESRRERLVQRALTAAVVLLAAIALIYPIWRKRETIIALHPVLAEAQKQAQATDALARDLERQVADYNFLLTKKHATYPVLAYVEEVSRLLPDNTWLQQLDVKSSGKTREVVITGETTSSSKLIEILEQSKLLQNAAPRGGFTRGSTPSSERFMIGAEVRPRVLPEATPVLQAQSGAPQAAGSAMPLSERGPGGPGPAGPAAPAVATVTPSAATASSTAPGSTVHAAPSGGAADVAAILSGRAQAPQTPPTQKSAPAGAFMAPDPALVPPAWTTAGGPFTTGPLDTRSSPR